MSARDDPGEPEETAAGQGRGRRLQDFLIATAIVAATLAALVATSRDYGMAWDEGFTVQREQMLEKWVACFREPPAGRSRWDAFRPAMLRHYWRFGREEPDGHPPFYAILGLAGWHATRGVLSPLTAYRFGPMVLAALTAGAVYLHLAARCNRLAALTAATTLTLMPRTFTHAHYAHYDMPMTNLWLLAQIAFIRALEAERGSESGFWRMGFGLFWGLSASTKFTGFLVPVGPLIWVLIMAADGLSGHVGSRRLAVRGRLVHRGGPACGRPCGPGCPTSLVARPHWVAPAVSRLQHEPRADYSDSDNVSRTHVCVFAPLAQQPGLDRGDDASRPAGSGRAWPSDVRRPAPGASVGPRVAMLMVGVDGRPGSFRMLLAMTESACSCRVSRVWQSWPGWASAGWRESSGREHWDG